MSPALVLVETPNESVWSIQKAWCTPPPPLLHHLQELCEDVQAAWDGLSQDTIRNLYSSIPRRLACWSLKCQTNKQVSFFHHYTFSDLRTMTYLSSGPPGGSEEPVSCVTVVSFYFLGVLPPFSPAGKRTETRTKRSLPLPVPHVKEMPIAATGQPATPEPRVCLQLPSGAESVPKRAGLREDTAVEVRGHSGGPLEPGRATLGASVVVVAAAADASHSPPAPSPLASPLHSHPEPPRTRSRSRSGFYGSNGAVGVTQQLPQHGHTENLRPPGSILSPGSHRHSGPGAHRNAGAGESHLMVFPIPPVGGGAA
ncbi:hypothetical protein NFI96_003296 [Prochilodus magdalenae]|nr:hypothetical protein NFI96_003296 [Prochilodus magdalenae]